MKAGQIEIQVIGAPDAGQLHVMATIERALKKAYSGPVESPEIDDERLESGLVVARRPSESCSFLIKEVITEGTGAK